VSRVAKSFFIPMVHSPPETVVHMAAPELPSQEDRARRHVTRGSTRAHLDKESMYGAEGHVAAPKLISVKMQGLELRDT
jgi:hypothetical protein